LKKLFTNQSNTLEEGFEVRWSVVDDEEICHDCMKFGVKCGYNNNVYLLGKFNRWNIYLRDKPLFTMFSLNFWMNNFIVTHACTHKLFCDIDNNIVIMFLSNLS